MRQINLLLRIFVYTTWIRLEGEEGEMFDSTFWYQLLGFMLVGGFGLIVNGVVYQSFMRTSLGKKNVFSFLKIRSLEKRFEDINFAWCISVLAAFLSNFLLNKYLVFKV